MVLLLCCVLFHTGDWIGGLPGPHLSPREHPSAIRWIEASTARATRRLTVSTTTPSAWPRRTLQLLDVSSFFLVYRKFHGQVWEEDRTAGLAGGILLALLPIFLGPTWVGTCLFPSLYFMTHPAAMKTPCPIHLLQHTHRQTRDWVTSQLTAYSCCCCAYIAPRAESSRVRSFAVHSPTELMKTQQPKNPSQIWNQRIFVFTPSSTKKCCVKKKKKKKLVWWRQWVGWPYWVSDRAEPFKVRFAVPTGGIWGGNPKTHAGESGWPVCMLHTLYRGVCMPVV